MPDIAIYRYMDNSVRRPVWYLVLGWLILVPLFYFATTGDLLPASGDSKIGLVSDGGSTLTHRVPIAIVIFICGTLTATQFRMVFALAKRMKWLVALPLLAILSSLWSNDVKRTLTGAIILFISTLFVFYFAGRFEPQRQLELVMLAGGVIVPLSILTAVLLPDLGATSAGWRGLLGHKNNCSMVAILMLITALHWNARGVYQKAFRIVYGVLCVLLIVMAQSRTGWGLACLAITLYWLLELLQRTKVKDAAALLMVVSAALLAVGYTMYEFGGELLEAIGKDPTLNQRTIIWATVWEAASKHLALGYGYSAFWEGLQGPSQYVALVAGWALEQSQNGFLDLWLQLGGVGVALVVIMFAQAAKNMARSFRGSLDGAYVRWCVVVLICTLAYNVGEVSLGTTRLSWFLSLVACVGLSQTARATQYVQALARQHKNSPLATYPRRGEIMSPEIALPLIAARQVFSPGGGLRNYRKAVL